MPPWRHRSQQDHFTMCRKLVRTVLRLARKWPSSRDLDRPSLRGVEVDFLVEAKLNDTVLSPSLEHFQKQIQAQHAFQAVMSLPYEPADCFNVQRPTVVPARTLLSQLP